MKGLLINLGDFDVRKTLPKLDLAERFSRFNPYIALNYFGRKTSYSPDARKKIIILCRKTFDYRNHKDL